MRYILALLNSKLLNFRYKGLGKQTGNGSFEYFPNGIGKFPIPDIDKDRQRPFIELVDTVIEAKKAERDTSELEKEIDRRVYTLYGMSESDIKLIEESEESIEVEGEHG